MIDEACKPKVVHVVFDSLPGPGGSRFVEVENESGESVSLEWHIRTDGLYELRILADIAALRTRAEEAEKQLQHERELWELDKWVADMGTRAEALEKNLIALARMYGEACAKLAGYRETAIHYAEKVAEGHFDASAAALNARDAAETRADALADRVKALEAEASFLLARLIEFENDGVTDDNARDWYGHVRPSMARLTALIAAEDQAHG